MSSNTSRTRLVVYTVLTGSKEALGNPLAQLPPDASSDLDIDFVCFTDNRALSSPVWSFRYLDRLPLPPEKASRRPKAMPQDYLPEWEYSLYIDNIVLFKRLPQAADLRTERPYLFKLFKHPTRNNPMQEAEAILQIGYEKAERVAAQLDFYAKLMPLEEITPLSTCTVMLRQHGHAQVQGFGRTWWEQILNFCKRDQMSFDFSLKSSGAAVEYFPGTMGDSELVYKTVNMHAGRVLANFDPVRYGWIHRDDPEARRDPRAHYLKAGQHTGQDYAARSELLEFLSYRYGSSLGNQVAPRRNLAAPLQLLLQPYRLEAQGRMLIVRVLAEGETAFDAAEAGQAEVVLATFMGVKYEGVRLELTSAQLASGAIRLQPDARGYELVILLGLPGELLTQAYAMLVPVLTATRGLLCAIACTPAAVVDVARVEQAMLQLRGSCLTGVQQSLHDSLEQPLRNSLLSFEWGGG